jgi:DNA-binding GntR family transcriptional regulator
MITSGELAPGERVTERGLAARLGVSPTPIREAISRLTHERLLLRIDGRTLQVAAPSLRHLREMSLIHAALSGSAAAGQHSAKEDGASLRHEFHALIAAASRNPSLIDMIATAEAFGRPLRLAAQGADGAAESIQHAVAEHEDIIAALRDRDGVRAEQLVSAHTAWIEEAYLKFAEERGLVAADGPPARPGLHPAAR